MAELRGRILFFETLLSRLGRLRCHLCSEVIADTEAVRCCSEYLHYCHASCFEQWQQAENSVLSACPSCGDTINREVSSLSEDAAGAEKAQRVKMSSKRGRLLSVLGRVGSQRCEAARGRWKWLSNRGLSVMKRSRGLLQRGLADSCHGKHPSGLAE